MHAKQLALAATGQIGDTARINLAPLVAEMQIKGVVRDLNSLYEGDQQWVLPVVGHPGANQYYVNTTMVQKLGLKMPPADGNWTFDDMASLAKGLTKSEGGRTTVYGILPSLNDTTANEYLVSMMRAFGG